MNKPIEPFLKWAGGKRWLVRSSQLPIPDSYTNYYEPFLGGGAAFFHLQPSSGLISDKNFDLMNLYEAIRDFPDEIQIHMERQQSLHSKSYYYEVRDWQPEGKIERAVRFLYLNRACWNGLYRVNQKGKFNVPIGTKEKIIFDFDDFSGASIALKKVDLMCSDFEDVIDRAKQRDFIFVDPPYTAQHNFNGFVRYNEQIFSWQDQIRLFAALERASDRGCFIAVTNADHESVRKLYSRARYRQLARASVIAGRGHRRGPVTEAVFTFNF